MPLELITPPTVEPVTLAEAKAHLKIETNDDDALLATFIAAARARAEWHLGRALITQGWVLWLDRWPYSNCVEIPLPPLQAVTSVKTCAVNGTVADLDASLWFADTVSSPARLTLNGALPGNLRPQNAIAIAFTAGYGDAADDVPAPIRAGILELIADLYGNRGDQARAVPIPASLAPYRMVRL